jgi:cysteate synthase
MADRLRRDGRFGTNKMHLHFVQNEPFAIMADAWRQASRELLPLQEDVARRKIRNVFAKILSNRRPPYSIKGGVYDALKSCRGCTYTVTNREAVEAGILFDRLEGCDLHAAAAVAVAGLRKAVKSKKIRKRDTVLLNITGGGMQRLEREGKKLALEPDIVFNGKDLSPLSLSEKLKDIYKVRTV